MKISNFFVTSLAVITLLASCSREENANNPAEQAQLTISIASSVRTAGTLTDESDNAVVHFKAFVFAEDELQAVMTSTDGSQVTATVQTNASNVYVISNANNNSQLSGISAGSINRTAFLALTDNLLNSSDALNVLTDGKVWGSGSATLTSSSFVGEPKAATVNVALRPIPARINVTVDDQRTNQTAAGAYQITRVELLNVAGDTHFIAGSTPYTHNVWYTGFQGTSTGQNPNAVYKAYFDDAYNSSGHYFYAFENPANADYATIVTLVINNGTRTEYYPLHFADTDAGFGVERSKSYQVAFTLTGNALEAPNIPDPGEEIIDATLTVTVTVIPWVMVDVPKEF